MNNNQTLEKMKEMRLYGMLSCFETALQTGAHNDITADQLIGSLIESEWTERLNRKTDRLIRQARFRYSASIEDINYAPQRNLDKNTMLRLADCSFIEQGQNIIITGATGTGKSYLASAFGYQACLKGYKVMYLNLSKIFSKLSMSKADGSYMKELKVIENQDLVIIDDFGLQPIDNQNQLILLDIIEERHSAKSTIITSQIPISKWYELIEDHTIADAILDRLIHTAHRIDLKGESLRKSKAKK
ncbi:IS21-like element helper ATPase IstB [Geoalkalibacter halelectricus]|uniref:IS21-like element helper ATPase IstB n=1 Tax=Geoalkalibacter halelectricus TaxID=2847045 RepID=A0ABY5ZKT0_9BACT|nr:IS21-like element helper ATPase IstB [Geoalkalibacter halelectricus]UWZ79756.1 IS21-like element helper ATPase IstB [Geoalkalibacter halelectricus]